MRIPILMYHSISDQKNSMSVSPKKFYQQMSLMMNMGYESIDFHNINLNQNNKKKFIITFDDGYEDIYLNALPVIKKLNLKATCFFVSNLIGGFNKWDVNKKNYVKKKLMNLDQIKNWCANKLVVGSHSFDHQNLKNLNYNEKTKQLEESKKFFDNYLNINVRVFSYPYGSYDSEIVSIAKKNYDYAVTTRRSRYKVGLFDNLLIPRIPINEKDSLFKFILKIKTFYEDIKYKN